MPWKYCLNDLVKAVGGELHGPPSIEFTGISIDTRTLKSGDVFFALPGTKVDGHQFIQEALHKGAVAVVVSKECSVMPSIVVPDTMKAIQQFARWHRTNLKVHIFGITGSCGKTTTKELISAVLSKKYRVIASPGNYNNELGCPLSLFQMDEHTDWGVIEMGAGKKGDIAELCALAYPEESVITTIAPAHLERMGSIEEIAQEKAQIAYCLPPWGYFYVNTDNPFCVEIGKRVSANKIYYGKKGDVRLKSFRQISTDKMEIEIEPAGKLHLPLCAPSLISNFLLAVAVSLKHQIPLDEQVLTEAYYKAGRIKTYPVGPYVIIDDCYNANPASMSSSLEYLRLVAPEGFRCAVLGDMLELGEDSPRYHYQIGETAGKMGIDVLYVYGNFAKEVEKGASKTGVKIISLCSTHEEIAEKIVETVPPNSWILIKGSRGMTMEKVIQSLKKKVNNG